MTISRPHAVWDFWNPRKSWPCTLQLDTSPRAGGGFQRVGPGRSGEEPKLGAARGCLASQIPCKGEESHGPVAGLVLTDLLPVVGGLAPSHALPEGTGSHRKGLLSREPHGCSLGRILSREALWQLLSWEMLWMLFRTEISSNPGFPPSKQAH